MNGRQEWRKWWTATVDQSEIVQSARMMWQEVSSLAGTAKHFRITKNTFQKCRPKITSFDLTYFCITAGWSFLICQLLGIAVHALLAGPARMPEGDNAFVVFKTGFDVAAISSVVTGLIRRKSLINGGARDLKAGVVTYAINLVIWSFGMALASGTPGSALMMPDAPVQSLGMVIAKAPVSAIWFLCWGAVYSIILSPLIGSAIILSQLFMSFAAKATWRSSHA